jgi:flagellar L-ring protein precursor FlgH
MNAVARMARPLLPRPRPLRRGAPLAVAALAMLASGCADRLDHIGKPPTITAPGAQINPIAPITAERAAIAQPRPAPPPETYAVASTWRAGPNSLFGDRRARTVGDILTVVVEMDDEAQIANQSSRQRAGAENVGISALLGLTGVVEQALLPAGSTLNPAVELGTTSSSSGQGATRRSEKITLRVAATVTDVLPNGHLVVQGSQEVRVNFELRDLQVAGVIRPEDISRRNEITYDKIADARVAYGGRGQITDVQQPRYGQQVLDVVMPF